MPDSASAGGGSGGGGGGGDDVDVGQLREIIAYTDAEVARMPASDYKAVVVQVRAARLTPPPRPPPPARVTLVRFGCLQVRTALSWPEARIAAMAPAERQELLTLRAELQAALRRMG